MNSPSLASNKEKKEKKNCTGKEDTDWEENSIGNKDTDWEEASPAKKIQIEKKDSILIEQSPLPQSVESEKEELKSSSDYSCWMNCG